MAIRFRSVRNCSCFESDSRLRATSLGGFIIVHHVRALWIASKKIRHGRNSRFVHRNGVARAAGCRLSHFFKDERSLNFWTAAHFIVDLVNERGDCHGGAAGLVRAPCAAFSPYHPWLFSLSCANRPLFPRRVFFPRAIHPQPSYQLRDGL